MSILARLALAAALLAGTALTEACALEFMFRSPQQAAAARNGNGISNGPAVSPNPGTQAPTAPTAPADQPPSSGVVVGCRLVGSKANIEFVRNGAFARIEWTGRYVDSGSGTPVHSPRAGVIVGDRNNSFQNFTVPLSGSLSGITSGAIDFPGYLITDAVLFAVQGETAPIDANASYELISVRLIMASGYASGC